MVSNETVTMMYKLGIAGIDDTIGTHKLRSLIYRTYRPMMMNVDNSMEDAAS